MPEWLILRSERNVDTSRFRLAMQRKQKISTRLEDSAKLRSLGNSQILIPNSQNSLSSSFRQTSLDAPTYFALL